MNGSVVPKADVAGSEKLPFKIQVKRLRKKINQEQAVHAEGCLARAVIALFDLVGFNSPLLAARRFIH